MTQKNLENWSTIFWSFGGSPDFLVWFQVISTIVIYTKESTLFNSSFFKSIESTLVSKKQSLIPKKPENGKWKGSTCQNVYQSFITTTSRTCPFIVFTLVFINLLPPQVNRNVLSYLLFHPFCVPFHCQLCLSLISITTIIKDIVEYWQWITDWNKIFDHCTSLTLTTPFPFPVSFHMPVKFFMDIAVCQCAYTLIIKRNHHQHVLDKT